MIKQIIFCILGGCGVIFFTAVYVHRYDMTHDNCGHFNLMLNGLYEDLPTITPTQPPEE